MHSDLLGPELYLSLKESTFEMWKDLEWIDLHLEDVQYSIT